MTGRTQWNARWGALALGVIIVVALAVVITVQVSGGHKSATRTSAHVRVLTVTHNAPGPSTAPTSPAPAVTLSTLGLKPVAGSGGGPSGVPLPRGNLAGWKQVFRDDFPSSEDSPATAFSSCAFGLTVRTSECRALAPAAAAKWFSYPDGGHPISGNGIFQPSSVVSIADHELTFDLHPDPNSGQPLIAGMVAKLPVGTGSVRYAAVAVRFRAQAVSGYALSFELWPKDNQGALRGNMQFPAGNLDGDISSVTVLPTIPGEISEGSSESYSSGWHTAVTEWQPGMVRYILDGRQIGELHRGVPSYPMNWVLQLDASNSTEPGAVGTGEVHVAWVSAYVPAS